MAAIPASRPADAGSDDTADLPALLAEIADVIGREGALLFAAHFGGERLYYPANPAPDHRFSLVLGPERAQALGRHFQVGGSGEAKGARRSSDRGTGVHLEVPRGPHTYEKLRSARMRDMIMRGENTHDIALALNVSRRAVFRARQVMRARGHVVPVSAYSATSTRGRMSRRTAELRAIARAMSPPNPESSDRG